LFAVDPGVFFFLFVRFSDILAVFFLPPIPLISLSQWLGFFKGALCGHTPVEAFLDVREKADPKSNPERAMVDTFVPKTLLTTRRYDRFE
jgi:hypothetical protein